MRDSNVVAKQPRATFVILCLYFLYPTSDFFISLQSKYPLIEDISVQLH